MSYIYGDHLSDEDLVALCKKRLPDDPRPFTALVSRYQQQVFATCLRLMADRQEAEDQAQEVFIRVYRGLATFEGRAKFSTWLFQIAINTCRTALKKQSRRPKIEEAPLTEWDTPALSINSPEETIFARAEQDMAAKALRLLNDNERVVLTLRETEGLSYEEIAEVLNISLSAAKMRVMRARLIWQRTYQQLQGEET